MQRHIRRSLALLTVLFSVLFMASCSQEQPVQTRAAIDALDKETAFARKARISNLAYDALIDIAESEEELVGEARIQFDLSDASSQTSDSLLAASPSIRNADAR
jgi:hypothetical protein